MKWGVKKTENLDKLGTMERPVDTDMKKGIKRE